MVKLNKVQVGARLLIDTLRTNLPAIAATLLQPRSVKLTEEKGPIEVHVSNQTVAKVSDRFLSFTIDIAQVVGGKFWGSADGVDWVAGGSSPVEAYDFDRPKLRQLAQNLSPAYLRIGGTASDETFYAIADSTADPPSPYKYTMTREQWDAVNQFAQEAGLEVVFTLNAGKGPRDVKANWKQDNARELIEYSREKNYRVAAWSLGNEPNLFPYAHGLWLSMGQYAEDHAILKEVIAEISPNARLLGPSTAFWPVVGELLPILPRFLKEAGPLLDVVTWHYYPQQSRRSPFATRRASPTKMLHPSFFDETGRWATCVERHQGFHAPETDIWLEETGNAQCGGEPGLSNRFIAGFWWLDLLGQLARRGQEVIMRQNLSGVDYSLIDEVSLDPNPDYWNSLLWKRLMGAEVLDVKLSQSHPGLHVYAHRTKGGLSDSATVLVLNISRDERIALDFSRTSLDIYQCTADDVLGREVFLSGKRMETRPDGSVPDFEPKIVSSGVLDLPSISYAFVTLKLDGAEIELLPSR